MCGVGWIFCALPSANIIKFAPSPTRYAVSMIDDIRSSFQVIMNNNLSDIVLKMTNIEGRRVYGDNWENLDAVTLEAYIGILLLAGVYRSHGESIELVEPGNR